MEKDSVYRAFYKDLEQRMEEWSGVNADTRGSDAIITIPVVVHLLYNSADQDISDAQIHTQIDVLNHDYTATNSDVTKTPPPFNTVIGNAHLNFCLVPVTPTGAYTTGIERRYTSTVSYNFGDNSIKTYSMGGLDSWNSSKYLNIWVCNLSNQLLGYTEGPGSPTQYDGVVINYKAFGTIGSLATAYNKGRTTTHEIGHWLGLFHIWGDDGGTCSGSDHCADTPNQASEDYGCPVFPKTDSCSPLKPGIMFMNYMDYTDDACMYMFTICQAGIMDSVLNYIRPAILSSNGCNAPSGLREMNAETFVDIYPNPANDIIHLDIRLPYIRILSITAFDMLGKELTTTEVQKTGEQVIEQDVSSFSPGLYTLILNTDQGRIAKRFVIAR